MIDTPSLQPELRRRDRYAAELAGSYALGTLRGPARRRFERWMESTPGVSALVDQWFDRMGAMATLVPKKSPPPNLWDRIQERVLGQRTRKSESTDKPSMRRGAALMAASSAVTAKRRAIGRSAQELPPSAQSNVGPAQQQEGPSVGKNEGSRRTKPRPDEAGSGPDSRRGAPWVWWAVGAGAALALTAAGLFAAAFLVRQADEPLAGRNATELALSETGALSPPSESARTSLVRVAQTPIALAQLAPIETHTGISLGPTLYLVEILARGDEGAMTVRLSPAGADAHSSTAPLVVGLRLSAQSRIGQDALIPLGRVDLTDGRGDLQLSQQNSDFLRLSLAAGVGQQVGEILATRADGTGADLIGELVPILRER